MGISSPPSLFCFSFSSLIITPPLFSGSVFDRYKTPGCVLLFCITRFILYYLITGILPDFFSSVNTQVRVKVWCLFLLCLPFCPFHWPLLRTPPCLYGSHCSELFFHTFSHAVVLHHVRHWCHFCVLGDPAVRAPRGCVCMYVHACLLPENFVLKVEEICGHVEESDAANGEGSVYPKQ